MYRCIEFNTSVGAVLYRQFFKFVPIFNSGVLAALYYNDPYNFRKSFKFSAIKVLLTQLSKKGIGIFMFFLEIMYKRPFPSLKPTFSLIFSQIILIHGHF